MLFVLSCVLVLAYLWIGFGGSVPFAPKGYRVQIAFPQANELATGADVRIAGVDVGKVVDLTVDRTDNRTLATLELQRQYAPIPSDTRATLRIKTLLGETYVELSTGNRTGGALADGGRLPDAQVAKTVDLDQILATFDPTTRAAFQPGCGTKRWPWPGSARTSTRRSDRCRSSWTPGSACWERCVPSRLRCAAPSQILGEFFDAISRRQGELSGLITAADNLFQTTAQRNQDLADVFKALPGFERESQLTLPALTRFAKQADPVVRDLEPIASPLSQTFATTRRLAPQFRALFERLGPTVTASRRGLPALDQVLGQIPPVLGALRAVLAKRGPDGALHRPVPPGRSRASSPTSRPLPSRTTCSFQGRRTRCTTCAHRRR